MADTLQYIHAPIRNTSLELIDSSYYFFFFNLVQIYVTKIFFFMQNCLVLKEANLYVKKVFVTTESIND
jgi:hypothetical protein